MKNTLNNALCLVGINTIITAIWQSYELKTIGVITPNITDTFIAIILSLIIYIFIRRDE